MCANLFTILHIWITCRETNWQLQAGWPVFQKWWIRSNCRMMLHTVQSRAVDWSTVQFLTFLAKCHSTWGSNFPFINSLKILGCATNWDKLLFGTLQFLKATLIISFFVCVSAIYFYFSQIKCKVLQSGKIGGHNPMINLTLRDGHSYALPDYREKGGL